MQGGPAILDGECWEVSSGCWAMGAEMLRPGSWMPSASDAMLHKTINKSQKLLAKTIDKS